MDPATIAGLVLGALPLLISAAENYETTFQPFVTYRRHIKEIQRFRARLDAQRAIFYNECQLLLLAVDQNLTEILRNPNHPSRNDDELSERLKELLGSSHDTCVSTLGLINDTLSKVMLETAGFRDVLEKKRPAGKSTWSLFRQRIKISFSKNRLNDIVDELRLYNEDLSKLSNQICRLASNSSLQASDAFTNTALSHFQITQQASNRLFEVLAGGWSCDDRVEHVASMSLRVEDTCHNEASKVRFNLAFTCAQPMSSATPVWLAIESAPNNSLDDTSHERSSAALHTSLQKMGAARRGVRFSLPSVNIATSSRATPRPGPQPDLYTIGKLCRYFRQLNDQNSGEPCIGFLKKSETFKHFVYHKLAPTPRSGQLPATSLKKLLHVASQSQREEDWIEKLKLAKLLSLVVLRFHSTPWLSDSWSSSDVGFYLDDIALQPGGELQNPFINARLSTRASSHLTRHPGSSASSLATNEALFNLGIILIELGYDTPFEMLSKQYSDTGASANSSVTDFIAARRLGGSVHRQLNLTYGRLVEKCLNCNFGVATKLDDAELQRAVVVHVVKELDVCLEQYKAFNSLGSSS